SAPALLRGGRCRETPTLPELATRPATVLAAGGLLPDAGRPRRSSGHPQSPSSPRSSDLGCTFSGPNPYTSPFNVFGPLTFCLIFGVQSNRYLNRFLRRACRVGSSTIGAVLFHTDAPASCLAELSMISCITV